MARQIIPVFSAAFNATNSRIGVFTAGSFSGASIDQCHAVMPTDGTFTKLTFRLVTAPGAGTSWTLALVVNGSTSALSITLSDSDTSGVIDATVAVSAGDLVHYTLTKAGSAVDAVLRGAIEFEPTTAGQWVFGFRDRATFGATHYAAPFYGEAFDVSSAGLGSVLPAGTITRWDVNMADGGFPYDSTPGTNTITYTLVKNGVDQDGTGGTVDTVLTFTGSTNVANKTFSLATSAGDVVRVKCVVSGTPGMRPPAGTIVFESDEQSFTRCGVDSGVDGYQWIVGSGTGGQGSPYHDWSDTESDREWVASSAFTLTGLRLDLPSIGSGQSLTVTLRVNGVDTAITATVTDPATTANVSALVEIAEGDTLDLSGVKTGGAGGLTPRILLTGSPVVNQHLGCFVAGAHTTVTGTLTAGFGLDGDTHVEDDEKTFVVWADRVKFHNLPTSDPVKLGQLWNDGGTVKISAG